MLNIGKYIINATGYHLNNFNAENNIKEYLKKYTEISNKKIDKMGNNEGITPNEIYNLCKEYNLKCILYDIDGKIIKSNYPAKKTGKKNIIGICYNGFFYECKKNINEEDKQMCKKIYNFKKRDSDKNNKTVLINELYDNKDKYDGYKLYCWYEKKYYRYENYNDNIIKLIRRVGYKDVKLVTTEDIVILNFLLNLGIYIVLENTIEVVINELEKINDMIFNEYKDFRVITTYIPQNLESVFFNVGFPIKCFSLNELINIFSEENEIILKKSKNKYEYILNTEYINLDLTIDTKTINTLMKQQICNICNKNIDGFNKTIDSIYPLKGHIIDNVQLLCRFCNSKKNIYVNHTNEHINKSIYNDAKINEIINQMIEKEKINKIMSDILSDNYFYKYENINSDKKLFSFNVKLFKNIFKTQKYKDDILSLEILKNILLILDDLENYKKEYILSSYITMKEIIALLNIFNIAYSKEQKKIYHITKLMEQKSLSFLLDFINCNFFDFFSCDLNKNIYDDVDFLTKLSKYIN